MFNPLVNWMAASASAVYDEVLLSSLKTAFGSSTVHGRVCSDLTVDDRGCVVLASSRQSSPAPVTESTIIVAASQ